MGLQEGWAPGSKSSTGGGDSSHLLVATPGLGWAGLGWGRAVGTAGEDRAHGQSRWSREAEASLLAWGSVYKWIHLFQLISWGKTRPRRMVQSSVGS